MYSLYGEIIFEIEIICKIISPHTKCMVGATYIYKCRLLTEVDGYSKVLEFVYFSRSQPSLADGKASLDPLRSVQFSSDARGCLAWTSLGIILFLRSLYSKFSSDQFKVQISLKTPQNRKSQGCPLFHDEFAIQKCTSVFKTKGDRYAQNHWHFLTYYFLISFMPSFFPKHFMQVKTIPLLYGAPSYKSGHPGKSVLRLAHGGWGSTLRKNQWTVGAEQRHASTQQPECCTP